MIKNLAHNGNLLFSQNNYILYRNYTAPVGTLTSYSGVLTLTPNGTFANGFNGFGSIWDSGYHKNCADVNGKTLAANITGSNVSFIIINWFRQNSDWNGTATYNVSLTNETTAWQFPNNVPDEEIRAFGDNSPIYMTWSAVYPVGENVSVSSKILESDQTMFKYNGENDIVVG